MKNRKRTEREILIAEIIRLLALASIRELRAMYGFLHKRAGGA